jgi:hypothetical protein
MIVDQRFDDDDREPIDEMDSDEVTGEPHGVRFGDNVRCRRILSGS